MHDDKDCILWLSSKGSLQLNEQQFGPWLRASQFNQARKSIVEVKGYEVTHKSSVILGQDGLDVAERDQMRQVLGATEDMGAGLVPECDQEGGSAMEAELYGHEMGNEGESLVTKGKGALIGAQDFEDVI